MVLAAILDILVKMMFKRQTDVIIGILAVDLVEKVYLYLILGALVQKLIFQHGAGGHFRFGPLAKKCRHFCEGPGPRFTYV